MNTYEKRIAVLGRKFSKLLAKLNRQARRDACRGDINVGWDWPTLAVVMPKEYAQLMAWRQEAKECRRALQSAGLGVSP